MKNKKSEQIALKQAHKQRLQAPKRRRPTPDFQLPPPFRPERQRFLIVCEGLNTEPDYFLHFRQYFKLANTKIVTIGGAGDTIRVVERAQKENKKKPYDQVWVVFDKDDFPANNFDNAIHIAAEAGFFVAYSNQAFEYWLILHFEDHQGGAMHRDRYGDKLNEYLAQFKLVYDVNGSKNISSSFFQVLFQDDKAMGIKRIELAIRRAEKVLLLHKDSPSPAYSESSTTVHRLVLELLKFV